MKSLFSTLALTVGFILLAGGNDLGLIGLIPAFIQMLKEDMKPENFETLD